MYANKSFIAIIPARGGSQRLPGKNSLALAGKPLIAWTIEAALKSNFIDEVTVSSDNDEIINISKKYGASVPFKRPANLANDTATRPEVINHTLTFYKKNYRKKYDYLVYLQPTSPLRTEKYIDEAIEYMIEKESDAVISVCEVEHPLQWNGILPENKDMSKFLDDIDIKSRSQDLTTNYRLNGAIYICNVNKFIEQGCVFLSSNIYAYVMPKRVSIDIDSKIDFLFTEYLIKKTQDCNY